MSGQPERARILRAAGCRPYKGAGNGGRVPPLQGRREWRQVAAPHGRREWRQVAAPTWAPGLTLWGTHTHCAPVSLMIDYQKLF